MDEKNIQPGYSIAKPVETQEQCDAYSDMAQAVNEHNFACKVGDMMWSIEDLADRYEVQESGVVPEPTPAEPTPQEDTEALLVDQEYRITLLELGV